jgi:hypothetical protein
MDFSGHLADAELQLVSAGFTSTLWIPEFGWENEMEAQEMEPKPPQRLAAIQLFLQLFVSADVRVWAHLAAEMQAGKTGVMTTFIRLVLANAGKLGFRPNRIFILTGMNDDAWKKQTRERMPAQIRENVQHSKGLGKVAEALGRLREKESDSTLSNVIVFLDESHIASAQHNQPYKQIWATLQNLCPLSKWQEKNIRVITISATDPAKVISISAETRFSAAVVRLQTDNSYQSVKSLYKAGRIRFTDEFGDLHTEDDNAIEEIQRCITEDFKDTPLYHILRPRVGKHDIVKARLLDAIPDCNVICWDASTKSTRKSSASESGSSGCDLEDINQILCSAPEVTTFILLKNMFYAAKTLDDTHVGILYDRIGGKDDTNLQSLLGRACGYGKSDKTIVYTSDQTVKNYRACWRELCSNLSAPRLVNIPKSHLDRKMIGITASTVKKGESCILGVASSVATPLGLPDASIIAAGGGAPARMTANEEDFKSKWKEFETFEEAKTYAPHIRRPQQENGFYKTSTTKTAKIQRYDEVLVMKGGKKTANLPWKALVLGKSVSRLYVGYKDIDDPDSAVFFIRRLTRIA